MASYTNFLRLALCFLLLGLSNCKPRPTPITEVATPLPTATATAIVTPRPTVEPTPTATPRALVALPAVSVSPNGYKLILDFEVGGGKPYYEKFLSHPTLPPAYSGITIGVGWDLSQNTRQALYTDWSALPASDLKQLEQALGATGSKARQFLAGLRHIYIGWADAEQVFQIKTLKRFILLARRAYPKFDELHPDAQAVLVSLTFNRGTSMVGDRRREMLEIQKLAPRKDYAGMAKQLRLMKRLWVNTNAPGLLPRREAEAKLMESCDNQP